jgi:selenocysteine lyase/cysteine desulfurase
VAVSAVQSADGRLADLDAIDSACADTGTRILVDATQAVGWLPFDASRYAYTVCSGWKWLLAPKGTCFFTVDPELANGLIPHYANWYAGAEPWSSIYGGPLRLANDARRFDMSPVWHSWVAQAPALDLLTEVGADTLYAHALGLASRFRIGVGLPPGDSAIVSIVTSAEAMKRLERASVIGSVRAGRLRLSFHVNNCLDDADRAAEVLKGFVVD